MPSQGPSNGSPYCGRGPPYVNIRISVLWIEAAALADRCAIVGAATVPQTAPFPRRDEQPPQASLWSKGAPKWMICRCRMRRDQRWFMPTKSSDRELGRPSIVVSSWQAGGTGPVAEIADVGRGGCAGWPGWEVAVRETCSRRSLRPHLVRAWAQVVTPKGRSGANSAGLGGRRMIWPSPSGRISGTPRPSSSASGKMVRPTSRWAGRLPPMHHLRVIK